ncbi:septum site-determining protein MinD [Halopenitus malekzadehii]|uniref:Septum site-determining protein MinD n=1 Tax=Halopenitus malekzadehii TaxID=1267564 RepID=A0A1H6I4B7_9EURY|nr:septum site-determining protein MinD [Halopenitus malekzadehii]
MIAVAGGKGGCGKTTTTLGLARTLPGTIRAVEGDWDMPNLHALAGIPRDPQHTPGETRRTPRESQPAPGEPSTRDATIGHRSDGTVRVIPPPIDLGDADVAYHLDRCRESSSESVVATLVDCPSGAGPDAAVPLSVADRTLLVTTLSPPALRDTAKTAAMARELDADPIGAVVMRAEAVPEDVSTFLSTPVLGAVPAVRPPVVSDARVRAAYREIADELRQSIGDDTSPRSIGNRSEDVVPPTERTPSTDPRDDRMTPGPRGDRAAPGPRDDRTTSGRRTTDVDPSNWAYPR